MTDWLTDPAVDGRDWFDCPQAKPLRGPTERGTQKAKGVAESAHLPDAEGRVSDSFDDVSPRRILHPTTDWRGCVVGLRKEAGRRGGWIKAGLVMEDYWQHGPISARPISHRRSGAVQKEPASQWQDGCACLHAGKPHFRISGFCRPANQPCIGAAAAAAKCPSSFHTCPFRHQSPGCRGEITEGAQSAGIEERREKSKQYP